GEWRPRRGCNFVIQRLQHSPGSRMASLLAEFDERADCGNVRVYRLENQSSVEDARPLAHRGLEREEQCYHTGKSPSNFSGLVVREGPLRYDEHQRRLKRVVWALLRKVQELSPLGRPTAMHACFQQGV